MIEKTDIFDYNITYGSEIELIDHVMLMKAQKKFSHIVTMNPEIIIGSEKNLITKNWIMKSDLILADGMGIKWAFSLLKQKDISVFTGINLVYQLLQQKKVSFYFVGASEKIIKKAVQKTRKKYQDITIVGYHNGYFNEFDSPKIINEIIKAKPDFILVGMGFPKQEYFIQTLSQYCQHGVAIGVGGVFDILSGHKKRAPKWMRKKGCEWLFRTIQEPRRIFRWKALVLYVLFVIKHLFASNKQA